MLRLTVALTLGLALSLLVSASTRDNALDDVLPSDQPAPTSPPLAFNRLSPSLTWGFVPMKTTSAGSQKRLRRENLLDRLDIRQTVSHCYISTSITLVNQSLYFLSSTTGKSTGNHTTPYLKIASDRVQQCTDLGDLSVCPMRENLLCCHPGFPVCKSRVNRPGA